MERIYAAAAEKKSAAADSWFERHPAPARTHAVDFEPAGGWFGGGPGSEALLFALGQGQLVRISDPFPPATAAQLHHELAGLPAHAWTWHRGATPGFQYQHHHLFTGPELLERHCPSLVRACAWFESYFAGWMKHVTGLNGTARASASWFAPGDFSSAHNDQDDGNVVAFVWHLTRGWDERDGGDLVWLDPYLRFPPTANTLYLFVVRDESDHLVQAVWDHAAGEARGASRRLAINGWFKVPEGEQPRSLPSTRHISRDRFVFHARGWVDDDAPASFGTQVGPGPRRRDFFTTRTPACPDLFPSAGFASRVTS